MALSSIDEERVLNALRSLDLSLWPEVIHYIHRLQEQPQKKESQSSATISAIDLANADIVGLWQERADITDSTDFARQLRADIEQQRMKRDAIG